MKKVFGIFVLMLLFSTSLVFAASGDRSLGDNLGMGMEQLIDSVEGMLYPLFSVVLGDYGDHMFEKILFMIILVAIIYVVISRMPIFNERKPIIWIITMSISLLATRFLTESQLVENILLPYGVLGVSLTGILPLIIYFYFVESFDDSATLRKILWIFYMVVFIGLWANRYTDLGELSWIYMISAILALIFLLFDGTIRRAIWKGRERGVDTERNANNIAMVRKKIDDNEFNFGKGYTEKHIYEKIERRLRKQLESLIKHG